MDTKKLLLIVGGVALATFVGYKLYQKSSLNPDNNNGGDNTNGGDGTNGGDTGNNGGDTNENTPVVINKMASDLFDAMNGCGTNNTLIYNTLNKVKGEQDWQNLIRAYGNRTITGHWYCGSTDFTGGLIDALKDEMGGWFDTEIQKCNDILKSKGCTTLIR